MAQDSNTIRIIGSAEIPEGLEMGFDYVIAGKVTIKKIEKEDNEDGGYTYSHKGKLQLVEIVNKAGKTFKGVAKGSKSQKLRWRIMEHMDNDGYEILMDKLIDNLESIIEFLKAK